MSQLFFSLDDAERILKIIESSETFEELEKRLKSVYPYRVGIILQSVKHFYTLGRPEIDNAIIDLWKKFTGGFIRLSDEEKLIDEFCNRFGVDKASFMRWYLGESTLKRRFEFEIGDFLFYLNYLVLRKILLRAEKVVAKFDSEFFGYATKRVIYLARNMYDLSIDDKDKTIIIATRELSLTRFAGILLRSSSLRVCYKKKCIDLEPPHETKKIVFDSSIEEELYRAFIRYGLKVRREPVIAVGDLVFIPDFEVCHKKCGLVEVVGYWRKWYLINKEIKIRRYLEYHRKPLILVISSRLARNFQHIKTPKLYYRSKNDLSDIAKKIKEILS